MKNNADFYGDDRFRKYNMRITSFLKAMGIDPAIFKEGDQYIMTEELCRLFNYILDSDGDCFSTTTDIINKHFDAVSERTYNTHYDLIDAAFHGLYYLPRSEVLQKEIQEKIQEQKKILLHFFEEHNICIAPMEHNGVVDYIIETVRKSIHSTSWTPTSDPDRVDSEAYDEAWLRVKEKVYKHLCDKKILVSYQLPFEEGSNLSIEKWKLAYDEEIPISVLFDIPKFKALMQLRKELIKKLYYTMNAILISRKTF